MIQLMILIMTIRNIKIKKIIAIGFLFSGISNAHYCTTARTFKELCTIATASRSSFFIAQMHGLFLHKNSKKVLGQEAYNAYNTLLENSEKVIQIYSSTYYPKSIALSGTVIDHLIELESNDCEKEIVIALADEVAAHGVEAFLIGSYNSLDCTIIFCDFEKEKNNKPVNLLTSSGC